MKSSAFTLQLLALSLNTLWLMPVCAEQTKTFEDALCPPSIRPPQPDRIPTQTGDGRVHVSADSATIDNEALTTFTGNVQAQQGDRVIKANSVRYDRTSGDFVAEGNLVYSTTEMTVTGDRANMNINQNTGTIENSTYYTGVVNGRGEAKSINILSRNQLELNDATYTTCPPGEEAWKMSADEIHLDKETSQGTASGVLLKLAHVPIMYFPYIRFPIGEERLTGFLYPGIGLSNKHGTEISIPFYWNIAPQMDATITPHNMTKRGLMLENEFRYLTELSLGQIEYNYLDDDQYGDRREKVAWKHTVVPDPGWSTLINYNYVSDIDYLNDFSSSLGSSSVTHLERRGQADYNSNSFVFTTLFQDYQTISGTEPYKRLPQISLNTRFTNEDNRLNYDINTEYVNFDHKDNSRVIGQRTKLNPFVSFPAQADAGFLIPKLSLHHLQYSLDQNAPTSDESPGISVPIFSLDTGLFFERDTSFADTGLLHTLEPRLFYLYAPYRNQDALPVFDTAPTTFSQTLLFSENRFSGNDRIGDANQLTTALTTRVYRQDNGQELFNATLGQIIYFSDREVTLPGQPIDTATRSSYLANVFFAPNPRVKMIGDMQWNPRTDHTEVSNTRLQYDAGGGRVFNLDQRFRRNDIRTQGASFAWRTSARWQFFGGHEYDLENDHRLENFLGVRYDDCCWGLRLVGIERFDEAQSASEPTYENAVYLEIELKGFSSIGSRKDIDKLLEDGILGYSR